VPLEKGGLCLGAKRRGCAEIIMGCAQRYALGTTLVLFVWVVLFSEKNKGLCFFSDK
jgi:hypothetical protein